MNDLLILTECHIDTLIAEIVSPPQKGYNHKHNCTKVLGTMQAKLKDNVALGIIDNDNRKPKELENFSLLKKHNEQLSIYKDKNKSHYVVIISKAAEDFILKNAQKCNIQLATYDLPSDLKGLMAITKHVNSLQEAKTKFRQLFFALTKKPNSDFYKLAEWIDLFKQNPLDLEIELL